MLALSTEWNQKPKSHLLPSCNILAPPLNETLQDAKALSLGKFSSMTHSLEFQLMVYHVELQYQFLMHTDWFLDTNKYGHLYCYGVDCILKAVKKE
jgi:hypothetical protein